MLCTYAGEAPGNRLADNHVSRLSVLAEAVQKPPRRLGVKERHRQPQHLRKKRVTFWWIGYNHASPMVDQLTFQTPFSATVSISQGCYAVPGW